MNVSEALIIYPASKFPHMAFYEELAESRAAALFQDNNIVYNKTQQEFVDDFKKRLQLASRDPFAVFEVYLEENKPLGIVTLFEREEYVHVYELQVVERSRYQGIAKKLLYNAEQKFKGKTFYGVVHKSNPMLGAYIKNGCSESPNFYQNEHPQWRKEDGWVALVYPSLIDIKESPFARVTSEMGLEAIQDLTGLTRPVFLIQDDAVVNEPAKWRYIENAASNYQNFRELNKKLHCIGAVENRFGDLVGTCWLIHRGFVCTNKHVAVAFYRFNGEGKVSEVIQQPYVNFKREHERTENPAHRFSVESLVYVDKEVDLAIFKLKDYPGNDYLVIEDAPFEQWKNLVEDEVFVVGYPGRDEQRNPEALMIKIFGQIYEKKRLAYGKLTEYRRGEEFYHSASTLGGNSGSPVIGTKSLRVLGLHFGGRYNENNQCVGYPKLRQILGELLPQPSFQ